jgi:coniferyl-aldehyde dehydrogenase
MKSARPMFPLGLIGARAKVVYQPKGVVGVIAPWNFPVGMVMVPMAGILAAGNRAMVKPIRIHRTRRRPVRRSGPAVFRRGGNGGVYRRGRRGTEFSKLAFDHLIFTGATSVGRHIMRAAADNLVPVTLELGGKSPTFIGRSANKEKVGRAHGAGQDDERRANLSGARLSAGRASEQEDEVIASVVKGVTSDVSDAAGQR